MRDKKPTVQECLEFLDKWLSDYEFEMSGKQIGNLIRIKEILERIPKLKAFVQTLLLDKDCEIKDEAQPPEVPDDLVGKILHQVNSATASGITHEERTIILRKRIRKLLQQRQQGKVTVTRGEIKKMAKQIFMGGPLEDLEIKLENIFRSKGIPVTKK